MKFFIRDPSELKAFSAKVDEETYLEIICLEVVYGVCQVNIFQFNVAFNSTEMF